MAWENPKTNWGQLGQTVPGVDDFNRIEENIRIVGEYNRAPGYGVASGTNAKAITAFYNQPPVIEAVASLDSPPAGVSIVDATYYGWGAAVKVQNTNTTNKQVTLVIQGKPLTVQNKERAIARDETSILENGVLRFEFPANPLVQTLSQAQAIADALLASVKEPRRDIEMDWFGNPALLLGDRVTVKGKDYHVIRQELDWQGYLQARLTGRKTE